MALHAMEGNMEFDFNIVCRQIFKAYSDKGYWSWTYHDFVRVFERFYGMYAMRRGCWHPHLTTETIGRVMRSLIEDDNGVLYSPEDYMESELFDAYFETRFKPECDYSIVHFTSGDVRQYKSYEAVI